MNRIVTVSALLVTIVLSGCGGAGASYQASVRASAYAGDSAGVAPAAVTTSATSGGYGAPAASSGYEAPPSAEPTPEQRAGLATQWGETRRSSVRTTSFVRADPSRPMALTSVHYNDASGSAVQASLASAERVPYVSLFDPVHGHRVDVSLRDEHGRPLPAYVMGDRTFVVGQAGQRYSIHIENRTPYRFETVVSVDGLDVIQGTDASLANRGYIVPAWGSVTIDGFRQSSETVAAFRFGAVSSSYAAQMTGSARNVGVVGIALFAEAGVAAPASLVAEAQLRARANPFPGGGGYAQPPPVRYGY